MTHNFFKNKKPERPIGTNTSTSSSIYQSVHSQILRCQHSKKIPHLYKKNRIFRFHRLELKHVIFDIVSKLILDMTSFNKPGPAQVGAISKAQK